MKSWISSASEMLVRNVSVAFIFAAVLSATSAGADCQTQLRRSIGGYLSVDSNVEETACVRVLGHVEKLPLALRQRLRMLNIVRLESPPLSYGSGLLHQVIASSIRYVYHRHTHTLIISNAGAMGPGWRGGLVSASAAIRLAEHLGFTATPEQSAWCRMASAVGFQDVCPAVGNAEVMHALVQRGASASEKSELLAALSLAIAYREHPGAEHLWQMRSERHRVTTPYERFTNRIYGHPNSLARLQDMAAAVLQGTGGISAYEKVLVHGLLGWLDTNLAEQDLCIGLKQVQDRAGLDSIWILQQLPGLTMQCIHEFAAYPPVPQRALSTLTSTADVILEWDVDGRVIRPEPGVIEHELVQQNLKRVFWDANHPIYRRVQVALSVPSKSHERMLALSEQLRSTAKSIQLEPAEDGSVLLGLLVGWASIGSIEHVKALGEELASYWLGREKRLQATLIGAQRLLDDGQHAAAEEIAQLLRLWLQQQQHPVSQRARKTLGIFLAQLGLYDDALEQIGNLTAMDELAGRVAVARIFIADGLSELATSMFDRLGKRQDWSAVDFNVVQAALAVFSRLGSCAVANRIVASRPDSETPRLVAIINSAKSICDPAIVSGDLGFWVEGEITQILWSEGLQAQALR
ncbi:MAG: hypothetical protein VX223_16665, partial [Myxococcota bacterium]|nr:hypothetical protein [Myxococcota bacterium]